MNLKTACTLALALSISSGVARADNAEKPGVMVSNTETVTATVDKTDKKTREIFLTRTDGQKITIVAPLEVKNFDQLKKGDQVNAEYSQALALYVHKTDEPLTHEESESLKTAEKGQKPGMEHTRTAKITAQVEAIDYDTRMMTLRGPKGRTVTFRVGEEVKKFAEIKKGDKVVADYSEATAISVTPGKK